jgi:hypothetical protein
MSTRVLPFAGFVPAALLLAGLVVPASAQQPCSRPAKAGLVTTTYAVADLVIPIDREPRRVVLGAGKAEMVAPAKPSATAGSTQEELLVKLIVATVQPQSWHDHGGPGTIDYFPLSMSLVINQTPDVQEQVADLLAALRRLQDQEVAVEVRMVTVAEDFASRVCPEGVFGLMPKTGELKVLDDSQLFLLMEAVQGDIRTNVMQAPKLTMFNGQRSTICVGDEQLFLTGVDVRVKDEILTVIPKTETLSSGIELSVQPVISADRRSVRVDLQALLKDVDASAPLVPINLPARLPVDSAGDEKPAVYTQYLQQPRIQKLAVEKTFTVPDGRTVVVDGGVRTSVVGRHEYGPPVLSDIPFLNRLFRNVGYSRSRERVLLLVTPRIIVGQEEEKQAKPAPSAAKCPIAELMKQFNAAYKEGKYEEAEKWAQMAQELDPDNGVCSAALSLARAQKPRVVSRPPPAIAPCAAEEPAATPCPATKGCGKKVAALVAKYHEACAAGRLAEARELAGKALAIDPTCFSKPSIPACGKP